MASESATKTPNGNHGNRQSYGSAEQSLSSQETTNPTGAAEDAPSVPNAGDNSTSGANEGNSSVPKDEVGWYFVEQYYTTLSKYPEKLHVRSLAVKSKICISAYAVPSFSIQSSPNSYQVLKPRKFPCLWANA